jgi:hypothetical protein
MRIINYGNEEQLMTLSFTNWRRAASRSPAPPATNWSTALPPTTAGPRSTSTVS